MAVIGRNSSVKCSKCARLNHHDCVMGLRLIPSKFVCDLVERHLGYNAVELLEPPCIAREPPVLRRILCLVCGDERLSDSLSVMCTESCGYGVHNFCLSAL